jgi:hypothetical protein
MRKKDRMNSPGHRDRRRTDRQDGREVKVAMGRTTRETFEELEVVSVEVHGGVQWLGEIQRGGKAAASRESCRRERKTPPRVRNIAALAS